MKKIIFILLFLPFLSKGQGTWQTAGNTQYKVGLTDTSIRLSLGSHGYYYFPHGGGGGSGTLTTISGVNTNGFTWTIANPTTTPSLTLALQNATTSQAGQLIAADWNTFNGKLSPTGSAAGLTGLLSAQVTTALGFTPYNATNPSNYIALTALSATSPIFYNSSTGVISSQAATGSVNGYLTATDWSAFNSKQAALVSGTNIKTINSTSLLGSGNILVQTPITTGSTSQYIRGDLSLATFPTIYTFTGTSGQYTKGDGTYGTLPSSTNIYNADGTITGNRTVNIGSTYGLTFSTPHTAISISELFSNPVITLTSSNIASGTTATLQLNSGTSRFGTYDASNFSGIVYGNTGNGTIYDDINLAGLSYNADFSINGIAFWGNRWIPDVGWVNAQIAAVGGVSTIGITTANGVSGTSSGGTTPDLTIALGNITPTSISTTIKPATIYQTATGTAGTDSVMVKHSGGVVNAISPTYYATTSSLSGYVPTSTTVAGFALSSNVTLGTLTAGSSLTNTSGSNYNGSAGTTLDINPANSNTFTTSQITSRASTGTSILAGWITTYGTAATNGSQQNSPTVQWIGSGFATTPVSAIDAKWDAYAVQTQGTTAPTSVWTLRSSINGTNIVQLSMGSNGNLTVNANLNASSGLFTSNVQAKHIIGASSAPTIAAGTGAGTTPTVTVSGTDMAGIVNITTGTSPAGTNAIVATVTFNTAYGSAPKGVVLTPANRNAQALAIGVQPLIPANGQTNGVTTTTFVVESGATALAASTAYIWTYQAIQ